MSRKWIEVNIHLKSYNKTDDVLREFVSPYVAELKKRHAFESWHFFREPAIRLRFFGIEKNIGDIKEELDSKLYELERSQSGLYDKHIFGSHGKKGEDYPGEADSYGENAWPWVCKFLEAGSDLDIKLCCIPPANPLKYTDERHVNIILNQLGFSRLQELMFHWNMAGGYLAEHLQYLPACYQKIIEIDQRLAGK